MNSNIRRIGQAERGSVLIISMILMIMLTVIGLAMLSLNTTQTRIAGNSADSQIAYQTAEGALNLAAQNIQAGNYTLADFLTNTNGHYTFNPSTPRRWTTVNWTDPNAAVQCTSCGKSIKAAYIIEYLPPVSIKGGGQKHPYRITAWATGMSGKSPVLLQGTVITQ
jgi:type IV pilus assembly protein PilX